MAVRLLFSTLALSISATAAALPYDTTSSLPSATGIPSTNSASDIFKAIPSCAQKCFQSFPTANLPASLCAIAPTLQCVCASPGLLGFTAGEGAVQCLVALKGLGSCQPEETNDDAIVRAYNLCAGQPGAATPTHDTIVATLAVDESSNVFVPTAKMQPTSSTQPIVVIPTINPSTTTVTTFSAPGSTFAEITEPTENGPSSAQNRDDGTPQLDVGTIVGLSVGISVALGLAVFAILFARWRRKRNYPDTDEAFFVNMEKKKGLFQKTGDGIDRVKGVEISGPLFNHANQSRRPAPPAQFPLGAFAPSTPGLPPPQQHPSYSNLARGQTSRLPGREGEIASSAAAIPPIRPLLPSATPTKPVLSIKIPNNAQNTFDRVGRNLNLASNLPKTIPEVTLTEGSPAPKPTNQGPATIRSSSPLHDDDSPLTEFEEDETFPTTVASGRIWRAPPPSPMEPERIYIADKRGNWVLADERRRSRLSLAGDREGEVTTVNTTESQVEPRPPPESVVARPLQRSFSRPLPLRQPSKRQQGGARTSTRGDNLALPEIGKPKSRYPGSVASSVYSMDAPRGVSRPLVAETVYRDASHLQQQGMIPSPSLVPQPLAPRRVVSDNSRPSIPSTAVGAFQPNQQQIPYLGSNATANSAPGYRQRPVELSPGLRPFSNEAGRLPPVTESPRRRNADTRSPPQPKQQSQRPDQSYQGVRMVSPPYPDDSQRDSLGINIVQRSQIPAYNQNPRGQRTIPQPNYPYSPYAENPYPSSNPQDLYPHDSYPHRANRLNNPGLSIQTSTSATLSNDGTRSPTWQLRLTPARRGDDLFLNVQ